MSVKKRSFDVERNPRRRIRRRIVRPHDLRNPSRGRALSLRERRRRQTGQIATLVVIAFLLLCGGVVYLLWQPSVRVHEFVAKKGIPSPYSEVASEVIKGTYFYILPRDSVFFYPEEDVRSAVLDAYPRIAALSISRASFTSLALKSVERIPVFWWCGEPNTASPVDSSCYEADAEGFIFAKVVAPSAEVSTTSAKQTLSTTLRLYSELDTTAGTDEFPLRARMKNLSAIPSVLAFVKELKSLQVIPVSLALRADEADLYLPSGTRLTYIVGKEQDALALARATFGTLNLNDGSIEYVDLRFGGKVYLKRSSP